MPAQVEQLTSGSLLVVQPFNFNESQSFKFEDSMTLQCQCTRIYCHYASVLELTATTNFKVGLCFQNMT